MDSEIQHVSNTGREIDKTTAANKSKKENISLNKTTESLLDGKQKKVLRNNDRKRKIEDDGYVQSDVGCDTDLWPQRS